MRERALASIADFAHRAGRSYASQRNFDRGVDDRTNVSMLSPFIRHRTVTEAEVVAGILQRQTPSGAFKSIQEVMWRTYWKGWLEAHPSVWSAYLASLEATLGDLESDVARRAVYERATGGETGIGAFDTWARELVEQGYLHNHARMWFASIWIFTLELPWELGADFFMRHLLDGDPASNTLSWRWVGGRQTIGKTYLATRHNVLRYTEQRLDPGPDLARTAKGPADASKAPTEPLRFPSDARHAGPALLVVHDDDFGVETFPRDLADVRSAVGLVLCALRSPAGVAAPVTAFVSTLARESVSAAVVANGARDEGAPVVTDVEAAVREILGIADARGVRRVIVPYGNVGPGRQMVDALTTACRERGFDCDVVVRTYDRVTWPNAGRGFFQFGKQIPAMLQTLGIAGRQTQLDLDGEVVADGGIAGQDVAHS